MILRLMIVSAFVFMPVISDADPIPGDPYNGPGGTSYGGYVPTPGNPYSGPIVSPDANPGTINRNNPVDPCRDALPSCQYSPSPGSIVSASDSGRTAVTWTRGDVVVPRMTTNLYSETGQIVGKVTPATSFWVGQVKGEWIALLDTNAKPINGWVKSSDLLLLPYARRRD